MIQRHTYHDPEGTHRRMKLTTEVVPPPHQNQDLKMHRPLSFLIYSLFLLFCHRFVSLRWGHIIVFDSFLLFYFLRDIILVGLSLSVSVSLIMPRWVSVESKHPMMFSLFSFTFTFISKR